jgi:hypothetical protein
MHEDQVLERRLARAEDRESKIEDRRSIETARTSSLESRPTEKAVSSWALTTRALGAAACELAEKGAGRWALMLTALGRELMALAEQPDAADSPRAAARALLLVAERAVKVAETVASQSAEGGERFGAVATSAAQLAQVLAAGAQARSAALLPRIADEELRANFATEFAAHARQAGEFAGRLGSTAA